MYQATISLPTFEEQRWPLRGPRYAVIATAAIASGFGAYMLWGATSNDQPFVHGGVVYLDVAGSSAVIGVIGLLLVMVALSCAVTAVRMVTSERWMVLGESFVEAPSTAASKEIVRIPYAGLRLTVTQAGSTAIEMRGEAKALIRVGTLNFANDEALQAFLTELRRRLAQVEEAQVW